MGVENQKESFAANIGKWVARTLASSVAVIGIIWIGLQYGGRQYDFGYEQGRGDISVLEQLIGHKDAGIASLEGQVRLLEARVDSSAAENAKLRQRLESKVVVPDTVIYEGDGFAFLGGHMVVFCRSVRIDTAGYRNYDAALVATKFTGKPGGESIPIRGWLGEQVEFEYGGKEYLLVVLGIGEYHGREGVKLTVYKNF